MKSLLFIMLLPLAFLLEANPIVEITNSKSTEMKKVEVEVEIEIGRKKKGCAGFGICKISGSAGIKGVLGPDKVGATLSVYNGSVISIEFHRETMDARTWKTYFSTGIFTIGETVMEKVGRQGFIMNLQVGEYKLNRTDSGFLLEVSGAKDVEVDVEVEIGRKKKGCAGFGVCGVVITASIKGGLGSGTVAATLSVRDGRVVAIEFNKKSMDAKTLKTYFSEGTFKVDEVFKEKIGRQGFIMYLKIGDHKLKQTRTGFLLEVSG